MSSRTSLANERFRVQKRRTEREIPSPPPDHFILVDEKGNEIDVTASELRKRVLKAKVGPSNRIYDFDQGHWMRVGDIAMPREVLVRDVYLPMGSVARLVSQVVVSLIPWMLIFGIILGVFYFAMTY